MSRRNPFARPLGTMSIVLLAALFVAMWGVASAGETPTERDARMAWWRDAKFGMFIHWGLFAVPAGEWRGQPVPGIGEWIMNKGRIPVADYAKLAQEFNPVKFNADEWVALAKAAGMKYLVITAKHHEGFAMFASAASAFNIVAATPFKHDPLKELAAACAKQGIKLGFYYSQSQDWHHSGGAGNSWDPVPGDYDQYLEKIAVPQVRELLTNYGPVAVLWYDTPRRMTRARAQPFLALQALQPGLIFNNRLMTPDPANDNLPGDTETPEQFIPPNGYPGKDWETCMTMNDTWGFKKDDHHWKGVETLLHNLSDISSKGGNFLLNVGPTAEGEIPGPSVERLKAMGAWLATNGEAVYGTQAGPFPRRLTWGRTTRKALPDGATRLFLHVWNWPQDGKLLLPGMHQKPAAGRMLAGGAVVGAVDSPAGLVVGLPAKPDDSPIEVAALDFSGPVTTDQQMITAGADGRVSLTVEDAELFGEDDGKPVVGGSGETASFRAAVGWKARYSFKTAAQGLWSVCAEVSLAAYNRLNVSAPGPFGRSIASAIQPFGDGPESFGPVELGVIKLPAGVNSLELKSEMDEVRPIGVRRIWLTPVK